MPSERVLNSGGPPSTMLLAYGLRSAIDLRWYLAAVAWVTVIESLSWAGAGFSTVSVDGSLAASAASTSAVVFAVERRVGLDGEQGAVVLRDDRDGALLDLRVVDLAGADVELGGDLDALLLQGEGVDLGEHLVLREVGRADRPRSRRRRRRRAGCSSRSRRTRTLVAEALRRGRGGGTGTARARGHGGEADDRERGDPARRGDPEGHMGFLSEGLVYSVLACLRRPAGTTSLERPAKSASTSTARMTTSSAPPATGPYCVAGQAVDDEAAEAAEADVGGDGRGRHHEDRRGAQADEDERQRDRHLDPG